MLQKAISKERRSLYLVWIIPAIALMVAGWMLFKYYHDKGFEIVITFNDGDGFMVGKTPLMYNGIKLGVVSDISINEKDISKVDVVITVDKDASSVSKEGNKFWKVEPRLSLTEVSGLNTILGGVYIGVMPSVNDLEALDAQPSQYEFVALDEQPVDEFLLGRYVVLRGTEADIQAGAPVMYRKILVGEVMDIRLQGNMVEYVVYIEEKFANLVKQDSKFWKISGLEAQVSLAGLRVQMDSLATLVAGAIGFDSPEASRVVPDQNHLFELYNDKSHAQLDSDVITLVSDNAYNIDPKLSSIYFKGVEAGSLVSIDYDPNKRQTIIKAKLHKRFRQLANKDAYFWIVEPKLGLTSIRGLDALRHGRYIAFNTQETDSDVRSSFKLHDGPRPLEGITLTLDADAGHNLRSGVNVLYNDLVIGSVLQTYFKDDFGNVAIDIVIADTFSHLVNDSSLFYLQNSVEAKIGLDHLDMKVGSLASIINGGISVITPRQTDTLSASRFSLHPDKQSMETLRYLNDGGSYYVLSTDNLHSVKDGVAIFYKGMEIGKTISHGLNEAGDIDVQIFIQKAYTHLINPSTSFYNVSGVDIDANLQGVTVQSESLSTIVDGGISIVTNRDLEPAKPLHRFKLFKNKESALTRTFQIQLISADPSGLHVGSKLIYKNLEVGHIGGMRLSGDQVMLRADVKAEYKHLIVEGTRFWIEDIRIGVDDIKNPASAITGGSVHLLPGQGTASSTRFNLESSAPAETVSQDGLRVVLKGSQLSSLKVGSPLFYRQFQIGTVEQIVLDKSGTTVDVTVFIDPCYAHIIRKNSRFYHAIAVKFDVGFLGVDIRTETLATMIRGGVNVVTPEDFTEKASAMENFVLHDVYEDKWLEWSPVIDPSESACSER
jgi:paraquat-inducible protein B